MLYEICKYSVNQPLLSQLFLCLFYSKDTRNSTTHRLEAQLLLFQWKYMNWDIDVLGIVTGTYRNTNQDPINASWDEWEIYENFRPARNLNNSNPAWRSYQSHCHCYSHTVTELHSHHHTHWHCHCHPHFHTHSHFQCHCHTVSATITLSLSHNHTLADTLSNCHCNIVSVTHSHSVSVTLLL